MNSYSSLLQQYEMADLTETEVNFELIVTSSVVLALYRTFRLLMKPTSAENLAKG